MKRFTVEISRRVTLATTLEVEARDRYEAKSLVAQRLLSDIKGLNEDFRNNGWDTSPLVVEDAGYSDLTISSVQEVVL
ncbi:MAG TPA: hypothetical protein DD435_10815 [Cyanobacteria bacterium UBA8530]|nr:hypothetical protein [Cyanobacteria bacterium UBA8530]